MNVPSSHQLFCHQHELIDHWKEYFIHSLTRAPTKVWVNIEPMGADTRCWLSREPRSVAASCTGGSSGPFFFLGGGSFGGAKLTYPILDFVHGFRPFNFPTMECWCLLFSSLILNNQFGQVSSLRGIRTGGSLERSLLTIKRPSLTVTSRRPLQILRGTY